MGVVVAWRLQATARAAALAVASHAEKHVVGVHVSLRFGPFVERDERVEAVLVVLATIDVRLGKVGDRRLLLRNERVQTDSQNAILDVVVRVVEAEVGGVRVVFDSATRESDGGGRE